MTLDEAEMDLSKTFEAGQGYVALSRLKNWDGLVLKGINSIALKMDGLAFKADARFRELSMVNENHVTGMGKEYMEVKNIEFIKACGGITDLDRISKNEKKGKHYQTTQKKQPTALVTKKLVLSGKTIEEIAEERKLTIGTVINHLQKIKKEDPEFDMEAYRPPKNSMEKVRKTIVQLRKESDEASFDSTGNIKIGAIYKALDGRFDYEKLRLIRLFLDEK